MKRFYALRLLVAIAMVAGAVACSGDPEPAASDAPGGNGAASEPAAAGGGGDKPAKKHPKVGIGIASPKDGDTVKGNVAYLRLNARRLDTEAGDHFVVFVDRKPVKPGEKIPNEADVVRFKRNVIPISGLTIGEHTFNIVGADTAGNRLPGEPATVTVDVEGPSVTAEAPRTIAAGEEFAFEITADGVEVSAPDAGGRNSRHYVILVDKTVAAAAGEAEGSPIPTGDGVIHTGDSSVSIPGLEPGYHVVRIVVANGEHIPLVPVVSETLEVTVTE